MSKSQFNVVPPDELIERFGADTERVYTLFIAPPQDEAAWDDQAIIGQHRFLNRVWNYGERIVAMDAGGALDGEAETKLQRRRHQTIAGVTSRIERFNFNTAISSMMEYSNAIGDYLSQGGSSRETAISCFETLLQLLHPFAPHLTEEWWEKLGHETMLVASSWPVADSELAKEDFVTIVVQVNGKLRGEFEVEAGAAEGAVIEAAKSNAKVAPYLEGKTIVKTIHIPGRLVNLVVK